MPSFPTRVCALVMLVVSAPPLPAAVPLSAAVRIAGQSCVGLSPPIDGVIVQTYSPRGRYEGHWGVDWGETSTLDVTAAAGGVVTFSGVVVDNRTVTIDHGGGLKTSYSYLAESRVARGDWVRRGSIVGGAGFDSEHGDLHFSVRLDGTYADPEPMLGCRWAAPFAALRLTRVSR